VNESSRRSKWLNALVVATVLTLTRVCLLNLRGPDWLPEADTLLGFLQQWCVVAAISSPALIAYFWMVSRLTR
jgi:hypothetical protein